MARVGDDWFADMMRLPKPMLIDFLRRANLRARNAEAALSAATNKRVSARRLKRTRPASAR